MSEYKEDELDKLQQLLDAYNATKPGTQAEIDAWNAYQKYLNELKRKAGLS